MHRFLQTFTLFVLVILVTASASADVPHLLNYQGRLTDGSGQPVADGSYSVQLRIYTAPSGGSAQWNSGVRIVTVAGGLFAYVIGDSVAIPDSLFRDNTDLWLGIKVGGDPEITPRTRLTSAGWSIHANTADRALINSRVSQSIFLDPPGLFHGFGVVLGADTILVPDSGYVVAEATGNFICSKGAGSTAGANIEFQDSTLTHFSDQEFFWVLPSPVLAGVYEIPTHIHRAFKVGPGNHSFYLIGTDFLDAGNSFFVDPIVMTLTYHPASPTDAEFSLPAPPRGTAKDVLIPLSEPELQLLRNRVSHRE